MIRIDRCFTPLVALPLLLTLAACGSEVPESGEGTATPMSIPSEGRITTDDSIQLYYRVMGTGGDTLIALHGGPGVDLESIAPDFEPLWQSHVVIFYDQRGTGRSTLPTDTTTLNATRQIADLDAVRRHFGLSQVTLVAHSYGPLLAATYALAHPEAVSRMVFFGPVPPYRGELWERMGETMSQALTPEQSAAQADAGQRMSDPEADTRQACQDYWAIGLIPRLAEPERTLPRLRGDLCAGSPEAIRFGLGPTNRLVMASYGDWDLREELSSLPIPTLIVHGEAEAIPMDMVEAWERSLPNGRLFRVPNAGHMSYAEQPEVVWPEVERFLLGG